MDYCNGFTHSWSDDSYSHGNYPCPGPKHCPDARERLRRNQLVTQLATNVSIKVMIPVTSGGYTGQRDEWEQHDGDRIVSFTDDIVTLSSLGNNGSMVRFKKADLDAALRALGMHSGPVYRNATGDAVGSR